ncbi:MAG TPA: phenylacetate-CoA oxygenase/reductase subunit PaaK [Burkholderiaceae bacterium]|nr:phenylacetate-CoA oxygenase/reductase subunit PaaK [Burkholderiaceae bacterium]HQR72670.1 phenylacetate-CoA oxygenase/reductase subunit PaaK [Burkholderiaceae bacterium]
MTPRFHPLRVDEIRRETPDCVSVRFELPPGVADEFRFVQGQHVALRKVLGGEELRRSYSVCSGCDDGELRVAVKKVPGGRFSVWVNEELRPGDAIDVMTPEGRFFTPLAAEHAKHYVAFASGSGITPVLSLIRTTLAREPRSRYTLVYGNRRQSSVMFNEALEDLKDRYLTRFRLFNVFSREEQDVELFNGRIDAAKVNQFLATLIPADTIDEAFICGPASMIDEVEQALLAAGVDRAHVHVERFGVPGAAAAPIDDAEAAEARLTLVIDGVKREVDFHRGQHSILEAGRAAGLDLPYSCKGGMCSTCRGKLLEGQVRMAKNYALEPHEVAAGFVLTCQSYPLTERVLISYDER